MSLLPSQDINPAVNPN